MDKLKKLGVIGGMGPEASCFFYSEVIKHTKAAKDQEHIDMLLLSHATIPDRTTAILTNDDKELLKAFERDLKIMENFEASNIAIPCNTSHFFYDKIQSLTDIPIIHMPRETVKYAASNYANVKKIGIMGTDGTVNAGVYSKECELLGIEPVVPSADAQKAVMSLIYDDVKAGKKGDFHKFERALEEFIKKDCDVVILACTEISVFKQHHVLPQICLDAMDVLIKESILRSGATYI